MITARTRVTDRRVLLTAGAFLALAFCTTANAAPAIAVFPPTGIAMTDDELEWIGVELSDLHAAVAGDSTIASDRSGAALRGAASYAAAARSLGAEQFLSTTVARTDQAIILTLTLYDAAHGGVIDSATKDALSMEGVPDVLGALLTSLYRPANDLLSSGRFPSVGSTVRVALTDETTIVGRLTAVDDESVTLSLSRSSPRRVLRTEVLSMDLQETTRAQVFATWTFIFTGTGAALGYAFWAFATNLTSGSDSQGGEGAGKYVLAPAVVGFAIGAAVGSAIDTKWRPVDLGPSRRGPKLAFSMVPKRHGLGVALSLSY